MFCRCILNKQLTLNIFSPITYISKYILELYYIELHISIVNGVKYIKQLPYFVFKYYELSL